MNRSRTYEATGIVLRSRLLGETDRIVIVYTLEEGKLSAVAKGARRANSKLGAAAQPFCYARFGLARGKSLDVLTQFRLLDSFYGLRSDLNLLTAACSTVELVERACEERHPDPDLFALLLGALHELQQTADAELTFWRFVFGLLNHLGYAPVLHECARCGSNETAGAQFSPSVGGRVCRECVAQDPKAQTVDRATVLALRWLADLSTDPPPSLDEPTRRQLQRAVEGLLEHRLEIHLQSQEWAHTLSP